MYVIPNFPKFISLKNIKLEDYAQLYPIDNLHADFSFKNLEIWLNLNNDLLISKLNNNLVFSFSNIFDQNKPSFSLLGKTDIDESMLSIFDYQTNSKIKPLLEMIPDDAIKSIEDPSLFEISEDRADWDYILDTNKLFTMPGNRFRSYRRKVLKFMKLYGENVVVKITNLENKREQERVINALHKWNEKASVSGNDREGHEGLALNRGFVLFDRVPCSCLSIYIDNKLEAVCIFQTPDNHKIKSSIAIANHIKCNYNYENIFDFSTYCLAEHLQSIGIDKLNFEQDLGIEGLREHKQLLRPIDFYKKYTVAPAKDR